MTNMSDWKKKVDRVISKVFKVSNCGTAEFAKLMEVDLNDGLRRTMEWYKSKMS
jgi:hypothetical protein